MSTDTSSKRVEANKKNAARSTGPRSAAGKDRSRFNAVKHGMAAKLPVLPGEDPDAFRAHRDAWTAELQPRGQVERQLVDRAVHVSWQLQRVDRAQAARLASEAQAAARGWPPSSPTRSSRWAAASSGTRSARCRSTLTWARGSASCSSASPGPRRSTTPTSRRGSSTGSRARRSAAPWLLDRWGELRQRLETGGNWQPPERLKAIRLLGRQPMDAPQDDRVMMIYLACWAMDPTGPHGFADLVNELQPAELKLWIDRLDDRRAMSRRPASPEAGEEEVLKIIAAEEERLEEVLELHLERDEAGGLEPLLFDDSESGERLRRYQLACNRTLLRILDTLERRQRARGKARAEPAATVAADRLADIMPPPAAASTPQDTAGPPVPEDRMPAIDEPAVLDSEPAVLDDEPVILDDEPPVLDDEPPVLDDEPADASSPPSADPADECPAPAEIAAPVERAGAATGAKLPAFPGETAVEGRNSQNEPNEPAGAAGGRALDGLAALLALLKLAVVVLFSATAAVKGAWAMALESPFRKARLAVVGWAQPGDTKAESREGRAQEQGRADEDPGTRIGSWPQIGELYRLFRGSPRTRSDTSPARGEIPVVSPASPGGDTGAGGGVRREVSKCGLVKVSD